MFESVRHGYRLTVPEGWFATEYPGTWSDLDAFGVGVEVPGEDVVAMPDFSSFLVMNSMAIPADMTQEEWLAAFDELVSAAITAECPGERTDETLAGEPAAVISQACGGSQIVGRSLTHHGRGYYFTALASTSDPAAIAALASLVESIQFTD